MTVRHVACSLLAALAALAASSAPAQDAAPTYYSVPSPGWVQRVAAGSDGSVFGAGVTVEELPGTVVPPVDGYGSRHVFVSAWAADGRLRWTTYLPFPAGEGFPTPRAVAASTDGSVWVACCAYSTSPYPDVGWGRDDVCVARVGGDGSLLVAQRIGGTGVDRPTGLVVTQDGDAIVAGSTWSSDLPTTDGSTLSGGVSGAFVARVRGNGSGVAWSRILDVSGNVRGTALSSDGNGGVLAAFAVSGYRLDGLYDNDLATYTNLLDLGVVRLSADGDVVATTAIPHGAAGAVTSLAACPDGSMLAAGQMGYEWFSPDAFVMRVIPETGTVTALWDEPSMHPARIAVDSSGDVLVGTDVYFLDPRYPYNASDTENRSRLRRLSAGLRETAALFDRDGLRSIEDFAAAPDGALCVIGHGSGVSFAPVGPPMTIDSSFVARLPREGALAPSRVTIESVTASGVRLAWRGGDEPVSYVIERSADPSNHWDAGYEAVRRFSGRAHEARVNVHGGGLPYRMRVVAEFASGVRMASGAVTLIEPPSALSAGWTPRGVGVVWRNPWVENDQRYELQRRLGGGPWQTLSPSGGLVRYHGNFLDVLPPLSGTRVRYRLHVVGTETEGRSPWTYSNDVVLPAPSLLVRQVAGSTGTDTRWEGLASDDEAPRFELDGTFAQAPLASPPATFDPMHDDLRVWIGDLLSPRLLVARAGDPVWTRAFNRWTWEQTDSDGTRWIVTIDPDAGTFSVRGRSSDASAFPRRAGLVIAGLSYGDWSGGEIRRWARLPGPRPNLVLR